MKSSLEGNSNCCECWLSPSPNGGTYIPTRGYYVGMLVEGSGRGEFSRRVWKEREREKRGENTYMSLRSLTPRTPILFLNSVLTEGSREKKGEHIY